MLVPCQGHTAAKWQIWNLNQGLSGSDFRLPSYDNWKKNPPKNFSTHLQFIVIYIVRCELIQFWSLTTQF